ncbi:unnamed protein product [Macrosiphum euphorbiae]|uniref:Uncharacterized protein n=1 Tax=Macrosiphum euphorbiae TaxID=13131 RepID=A0AAV0W3W5_9HEMI|nr:unnamed protein product [Macrosiphum euphorbiae]
MDVVAALIAKIKLRYSTDCEPEVTDDGEKAFDRDDLGDYVVSMISAVVTRGQDEILEGQPCCYMPTTIETIETLVLQNIITPVCRRLILDILLMRDKTIVSVLSAI